VQVIPRMISQNAGFDSTDILNKLRQKHAAGGKYFGVDIMNDGICDTHETFVWEPSNIKQNAIVRRFSLILFARATILQHVVTLARVDSHKCSSLFFLPARRARRWRQRA
jgi:hypothetical protein